MRSASVLVDKFADGLPLNRQSKRMAREGFEVGTAVLASWVVAGADVLDPVAKAIDARLLEQKCLQGDDTGFPVQDGTDGHLRKARLWCYTDQQEVRFHFSDTKHGRVPATFLANFKGEALLVDCGSEFNEVVRQTGAERAACWSHLRRYFFHARRHHPVEAHMALVAIRELFLVERRVFGCALDPEQVTSSRTSIRAGSRRCAPFGRPLCALPVLCAILLVEPVDAPFEAVLEHRRPEVDEQAEAQAREAQVREHHLAMHGGHPLQRLQLDQDEVLHDQVGTEPLVERDAVKRDGDGHLAGHDESTLAEDVGQRNLVDRLE